MTEDNVVFIPTRARTGNLIKILPKWAAQKELDEVILVVDKREKDDYKAARKALDSSLIKNVSVMAPKRSDIGIAAIRHFIVKQADRLGLDALIMSDDDCFPVPEDDITRLTRLLARTPTIGIGACFSFYGLMLGNDVITKTNKAYLVPGGMGYRCFSLDVPALMEADLNYEKRLTTWWSDAELCRDAMKALGYGWHVDTGAWCGSIGNRNTPGGLDDFAGGAKKRAKAVREMHKIVYEKWGPRYISPPDKRPMCRWKNMLDDYVPNWRKRAIWL